MKQNKRRIPKGMRWKTIKRLLGYVFKYYPWQFIVVCICVLVSTATTSIGAYVVGNILVNDYITPAVALTHSDVTLVAGTSPVSLAESRNFFPYLPFNGVLLVLAGVYLVGLICNYFYQFLMSIIGQGVMKRLRDELFSHMENLPVKYFDQRTRGDVMSVYTNDIDALREMLSRALPMFVSSIVSMVMTFVMMLMTDLLLSGIVVLLSTMVILISKYYTKMSGRYFVKQQRQVAKLNGYVEEMTNGQRVVKVFNYEDRNIEGFNKNNRELFEYQTKANRFASVLMPTVNQLGNLQYVLIALIGGLAVINHATSVSLKGMALTNIGMIVSFLMFSKGFVQPIGRVSQQVNTIEMALAGGVRIFEMMDEPSETDGGYVELVNATMDEEGNPIPCDEVTGRWAWKHPHSADNTVTYTWLKGKINFYNVDFSYVEGKQVLKNISMFAEPGQKVALVGPTGAGKTTITNLINRFYDIDDGKIRYDGININKIRKKDLRASLGIVLQETQLFTATVEENIKYGKPDATHEEVVAAAKLANADSFINLLPEGYDTVLTKAGMNLSQGQRQLLAIARAAIANPPVMILDEATSSIDTRTEQMVQEGMDRLMKGRTVFVIAHRLSTVKDADVIMVIDGGEIIERGNHDELLERKGKYYQLYTGSAIK